jgi:hypothetical protein
MRLLGFGLRAPNNPLLGYDVAGRIEAVGAQITTFRTGDEVFGTWCGSFAEYATARPTDSRPSPTTSASTRPQPFRSPVTLPYKRSATTAKSRPGNECS